jgi:hypothetical protein
MEEVESNYVSKILPLPLAWAKNGDEQFWEEKLHAAHDGAPLFSLLG